MLMKEYTEEEQLRIIKAAHEKKGEQIGEQNTLVIMDRLMSGETVEELIQAGFKAEIVKSVYERIQTLQPSK
jgi:hypothetical protein